MYHKQATTQLLPCIVAFVWLLIWYQRHSSNVRAVNYCYLNACAFAVQKADLMMSTLNVYGCMLSTPIWHQGQSIQQLHSAKHQSAIRMCGPTHSSGLYTNITVRAVRLVRLHWLYKSHGLGRRNCGEKCTESAFRPIDCTAHELIQRMEVIWIDEADE